LGMVRLVYFVGAIVRQWSGYMRRTLVSFDF
jgi:hypothetical protein